MPSPGQPDFSDDGKHLAIGGGDNRIRVYSVPAFTQELMIPGMPDQPIRMAFSADDTRLVSAVPGQLRTWDLTPQGPPALGNFHATGGFVGRFAMPADGSAALVSVYGDNKVGRRTDRRDQRGDQPGARRSAETQVRGAS